MPKADEKRAPVLAPGAPVPGPEVAKLEYFVGLWTSEGVLKPGPLGPGGETKGRNSCRWMPGRFFVGCVMQDSRLHHRTTTSSLTQT